MVWGNPQNLPQLAAFSVCGGKSFKLPKNMENFLNCIDNIVKRYYYKGKKNIV